MHPGPLVRIAHGSLTVDIAPSAGGRIAQITTDHDTWLIGHDEGDEAMIAWGSYPMLPWAGRIRHGRFRFHGRDIQLPRNFGEHAIHGIAFALPWWIDGHSPTHIDLSLPLPEDESWPFGGIARQRIEVGQDGLRMTLSITAGEQPMPATLGWHPWFRKPDRLEFAPTRMYPRDAQGIATLPVIDPPPPPWDDCFLNDKPLVMHRAGQRIRLSSSCDHWVIYDETAHATCIEPQSGPPDAFNLTPSRQLSPGETLSVWYAMEWMP
ncbi:MAG TPA: aldose epimerase [Dyella sp.]|uniref:aldose 1-epimerase n=1 Tax=Dyella sp. TaxID=1869338 RepID=UPI002B51ECC8|nr:aldose epimerase [Dyella sp.]HTV84464.1 aldose epimerase [Dyella sp.]